MDNKPMVSRARQKRTQKKTRKRLPHRHVLNRQVILSYFLLLTVVLFTLNLGRGIVLTDLTPGQLAPTTVQAMIDFRTVDMAATQLKRERVAAAVPPVLVVREQPLSEINRTLESFCTQLRKRLPSGSDPATSGTDAVGPLGFDEAIRLLGLSAELEAFPAELGEIDCNRFKDVLLQQTQRIWQEGIINPRDAATAFQGNVPEQTVQLEADGPLQELAGFRDPTKAAAAISDRMTEILSLPAPLGDLTEILLKDVLRPNLIIDPVATQAARALKIETVASVTVLRKQGETLIEARAPVSEQAMRDVLTHNQKIKELDEGRNQISRLFGQGFYLAIGLAISLAFLLLFDPDAFNSPQRLFLWMLLTEASLLLGQGLIYLSADLNLLQSHYLRPLLPLSLAPMLATILYGPRMGIAVGISSSLAHALQHEMDLTVFFTGLALALSAAVGVKAIHRRSNLFRAGLWIGAIKAVIIAGAGILDLYTFQIIAQQSLAAFGSGLLEALLVLLLISPFETLFKVTTDVRLLELSDMSHPLLSRMALEAPGTYHHSLMVAHLAQAAAREIQANDLLVRVCAYYHDIGKLSKPEFFIENGQGRENPHDSLSPSMSRLLIISHVKEGVSLAKRYKLPGVIIDGIEQHHGTSVIQYFYHRARTQAGGEGKEVVKQEDYRYPGPKPKSTEMGLLMMADAIEAASRTIDKNKPGQVEGLVNEIIQEKLNDGQFDHCEITMQQINAARRSFIFSLQNMLHGRVEYPKDPDAKATEAAAAKPAAEPPLPADAD